MDDFITWDEANVSCVDTHAGHLASIHDESTNTLISNYTNTARGRWHGMRSEMLDEWTWATSGTTG